MSSSNIFEPHKMLSDELDGLLDQSHYLQNDSQDIDEFLDQPVKEHTSSEHETGNDIEDEVDREDVSLESYLNQWKHQQAVERSMCENAENHARVILGFEYRAILGRGLGRPEAIVQSWFDRPACMPPQLPLILELLKFCPPEKWPMRWQQAAFGNQNQ